MGVQESDAEMFEVAHNVFKFPDYQARDLGTMNA